MRLLNVDLPYNSIKPNMKKAQMGFFNLINVGNHNILYQHVHHSHADLVTNLVSDKFLITV